MNVKKAVWYRLLCSTVTDPKDVCLNIEAAGLPRGWLPSSGTLLWAEVQLGSVLVPQNGALHHRKVHLTKPQTSPEAPHSRQSCILTFVKKLDDSPVKKKNNPIGVLCKHLIATHNYDFNGRQWQNFHTGDRCLFPLGNQRTVLFLIPKTIPHPSFFTRSIVYYFNPDNEGPLTIYFNPNISSQT